MMSVFEYGACVVIAAVSSLYKKRKKASAYKKPVPGADDVDTDDDSAGDSETRSIQIPIFPAEEMQGSISINGVCCTVHTFSVCVLFQEFHSWWVPLLHLFILVLK